MKRQKIRKGMLITSLLLFPIIIWYFSPYLIIQAAMEHIVNGSFIVFIIMLVSSLFMGRIFCGYLCPVGGLSECAMLVNDSPLKRDWKYNIKYVIWFLWILSVILSNILGKGDYKINFFYMTDHGISISQIYNYIIYYGIVLLFLIPALLFGKRFACHYFCWMAPFMIIGSKIGRMLHIPQIHIKADSSTCIDSCPKKILHYSIKS
ncbi:MAG: 4Fe-4S binding protein [Velocimicrobium sp.]